MTHVLLVRRERHGKNRRWDKNLIMCSFFLFFFVFFVSSQIGLSSSASSVGYSRRHFVAFPPPRKALSYSTTATFRGPLNRDDIYGDDKRVVHTGPNPLHN
ncbi:PREDICTED: CLAVATA3/ESR (CLE)-related protein 17-like [Camelina sativa]|uniref:CLAVATA3/ESR (CLE)-related protein 17-like n=1 Tax=Camelina sativa TaxID=90675 RepID=A0ABM0ST83_CAMSA|nr:PREDICTED: CLAVATA3/ESR (CLE)-related protein 17-like [Camelina sativa]